MAEIVLDAEIRPYVDKKAMKNSMAAMEKELRSVRSGTHLPLAQKLASTMRQMVASGEATSATQARMILADRLGGTFSAPAKAILRHAQNITTASMFSDKIEQTRQNRINVLAARAAMLQSQSAILSNNPTAAGKASAVSGIVSLRRELLKLYQEYRVNRREVPPLLRQIAQNTSSLRKDINDLQPTDEPNGGGTGVGFPFKKALTLAGISKILSWFTKSLTASTVRVFGRGMEAMRLEAAYGNEADWVGIRTRAGLYNISRESAASTDIYASDFAQRMMWGEVSEREIIGLSRAGKWGKMVMSGEAAKNPELAAEAFQEMITSTDQGKMRSILRQLGLPQELMNYRIATDKTNEEMFKANARLEHEAARLLWDAANTFQAATEYWSTLEAKDAGSMYASLFPEAETMYKARGGYMPFLGKKENKPLSDNIQKIAGKDLFKENMFKNDTEVTQNIVVNNTFNGTNIGKESDFGKQIGEDISKALFDAQVNGL